MKQHPKGPDAVWICEDDGEQTPLTEQLLSSRIQSKDPDWFVDEYASILSKIELLGSAYLQKSDASSLEPSDYINSPVDWQAIQRTCDHIEGLPSEIKESMFVNLKTFQVAS
jgi:hypothetical protein